MLIATCSYSEYRPQPNAVPVRSSVGFPRWKLPYPLSTQTRQGLVKQEMPLTYPAAHTLKWPEEKFVPAYREKLDGAGVDAIRTAGDGLLKLLGLPEETWLVLLCYERLNTGKWCHRRLFADWWTANTHEEVPELGAPPRPPEIRAQSTLFD